MIPKLRAPSHPGEILLEEFLRPAGMTQSELAHSLNIPIQRINTIINGKRGITAETALLLAKHLKTTPEFWLNLQNTWDLYQVSRRKPALAMA
mgnify:CR=1 FL=1